MSSLRKLKNKTYLVQFKKHGQYYSEILPNKIQAIAWAFLSPPSHFFCVNISVIHITLCAPGTPKNPLRRCVRHKK